MRQLLHLLIVSCDRRAALAARYGARWLLPTIACGEAARAGPLVARWCAERGLANDVAGQWLGRVEAESIDWLMAIPARAPLPLAQSPLDWIDLDSLASSVPVLDYQGWALTRCLARSRMPAVDGPFGNLEWPEQTRAWIATSLGSPPCAWTPYRTSAYEVVVGLETSRGRVYFKGLSGAREREALLTPELAALVPDSFAPTLALETSGDGTMRWLTGQCRGRPSGDSALVAAALARVQQQLMPSIDRLTELVPVDFDSAARWAIAPANSELSDLIRDGCEYVRCADFPRSWIPMDLDPTNVMVHDSEVRFIDVDDSFAGPAPLAMATFARRSGDRAAYRAYERSWPKLLAGVDWERVEIGAAVFGSWSGWIDLKRKVERGEVYAALECLEARVRRRLERDLYSR